MKNWNQLLVRHGWKVAKQEGNVFDCRKETEENLDFLFQCLENANIPYQFQDGLLELPIDVIQEDAWIQAVQYRYRGVGGDLWFRPGIDEPKIRELDTYIAGIVRQLNRLGYYTNGSCDGHGKRNPYVMIIKESNVHQLVELLHALGIKIQPNHKSPTYHQIAFRLTPSELLDLAEKLSLVDPEWLAKGIDFIKKQLFHNMLEELLMIPGASGDEAQVRNYVLEKLTPHVDHLTVDRYGNILAEKTYRGGQGPTILLNAHLDTVFEIDHDRKILKEGNSWTSSKGILGADDRAGVAVILHQAEQVNDTSFSGKIKFIFTVEEECGLVGASQVDDYFLWNIDAAIVVDRRGNGDIVTSCGGYIQFCDTRYGEFFEKIAVAAGLSGWAVTKGGSSDTAIWAQHGIQSVNLSAGYKNEHSERESLNVDDSYRTAELVKAVMNNGRELQRTLRTIEREKYAATLMKRAL
ncbi:M20/M25/M40 family metallo-hydrolase [Bacillus marasmi]|uniref:M20/M25/M40 family metallo-hydrolase n=1 Tax=Bacillus marasmi TaxID=1926279 RepID=UPI0011CCCA0A|nr:M20/M25/M40 family metallo-hydrolase [Bacillus marasmi]